ncbi:ProQ/FinO family protein [Roseateles amylovorans]|uniref:ProQ/FinO family protein n=1 Tax=Roseateles amylovorans TaxID=2978473 RepID=A0ABY6B179_9BURK|nr:ProQ/FinO family protein [Roseateles amylovorans]UXH78957.1 ProQ/FinO family protein [Roseateles amylovorans]
METPSSLTSTGENVAAPEASDDPATDSGASENSSAGPAQAAEKSARVDVPAIAAALKELFPALFAGAPKPLKLRIQADIQERAAGRFTKAQLSAFLRRYTGGTGYLIALSRAKQRFDLDGQPAGELSDEHRDAAVQELTRRRGITEARRAEEDRGRQERAQLLRDFSRTTLTPTNFGALKGLSPEQLDEQLALARKEESEQPVRTERQDRPPRGGDRRPGAPRDARGDQRGPGGRGGEGRGDRGPRADGPGRPNDGRRPPRQPR